MSPIQKEETNINKENQEYKPDYSNNIKIDDPKHIVSKLSNNIYGQENAKKTLALSIQNIQHRIDFPEIDLKKANVLLIGPTGSGKTYLVNSLVEIMNYPIVNTQMTSMTSMGYTGNSIDDLFYKFKIDEEKDQELFQALYKQRAIEFHNSVPFYLNTKHTICYLDEIDKIAFSGSRIGFAEELQNELIGYVEDGEIYKKLIPTNDMLFIASGAFSGLEEIISKRVNKKGIIGFKKKEDNIKQMDELFSQTIPKDLIEYGFKPEIIARFPNIAYTKPLLKNDIVQIIKMKNSHYSKQREILKKAYNINLILPKKSKEIIAQYVIDKGENARGIQRAINLITEEYFYNSSDYKNKEIIISQFKVEERLYKR